MPGINLSDALPRLEKRPPMKMLKASWNPCRPSIQDETNKCRIRVYIRKLICQLQNTKSIVAARRAISLKMSALCRRMLNMDGSTLLKLCRPF